MKQCLSRKKAVAWLLILLLMLPLMGCGDAPSEEEKDDAINASTNEMTDEVMDEGKDKTKDEVKDEGEEEPVRPIAPTVQDPSVFLGILPLSEEQLSENGATEHVFWLDDECGALCKEYVNTLLQSGDFALLSLQQEERENSTSELYYLGYTGDADVQKLSVSEEDAPQCHVFVDIFYAHTMPAIRLQVVHAGGLSFSDWGMRGDTEPYSTVAYKAEEEEPEKSDETTTGGNSSGGNSGSSNSSSGNGGGSGGGDYVAPGYDPYIPDASKLQCLTCHGDGDCNSCGGSGYKYKNDIRSDCTRCTGGNCPACGGSGTR